MAYVICKQVASGHCHQVQIDLPPPVTGSAMSEHTSPCRGLAPGILTAGKGREDLHFLQTVWFSKKRRGRIWTLQTQYLFPNVRNSSSSKLHGRRRLGVLYYQSFLHMVGSIRSWEVLSIVPLSPVTPLNDCLAPLPWAGLSIWLSCIPAFISPITIMISCVSANFLRAEARDNKEWREDILWAGGEFSCNTPQVEGWLQLGNGMPPRMGPSTKREQPKDRSRAGLCSETSSGELHLISSQPQREG